MENNDEWISVGDLRVRVRALLPMIRLRPADWPRGVGFVFDVDGGVDGSRYGYTFLSPSVPLSQVHYTARISLSTVPFFHPYQLDVFSHAVADYAIRAFRIERHDAYLRRQRRRRRPRVHPGSQNPNLLIQVNIYSNTGRRVSVRGGGTGRLVSSMDGDRSGMFDDNITFLLDAIERLVQDDGNDTSGFGAVPASGSFLNSLPSTLYSESSAAADAEEQNCSICFEKLVAGDRVAELPCSHLFHTNCIVPWLQSSHLCPLCRRPLPIDQ